MATLKTTLKVESTDLFPTPINFTKVNNNAIGATYSTFTSITVGTSTVTLQAVPTSGAVLTAAYVYAFAPSTNTGSISLSAISPAALGTGFCLLAPGDVAFFPYGDGTAASIALTAIATAAGQQLEYFIGNQL